MKKLFFLLILFSACSSCDDESLLGDTTAVNLNFKAEYSGEPLVTNDLNFQYKYPDGKEVAFNTFNYFISDVKLIEADGGGEVELIDIQFVDFGTNTTLEEAQKPITFNVANIPTGSYKGLKIGIGVPAELNNSSYNQLGSNHPLRVYEGEYWSGWESFIFLKVGGSYDKDADGLGIGEDAPITHHLGSDAVYRTVTIDKPMELIAGQAFELNILTDVLNLYQLGDDYLDMSDPENRVTHNPDNLDVAHYLMDRLSNAITIEQ